MPYEQLRKSFRYEYKYIEKELITLQDKIERCIKDNTLSAEKATETINELMKQVDKLKRKVRYYGWYDMITNDEL